jgi:hypothetical protein
LEYLKHVADYQYPIAWGIYVLAGMGCCVVWWRMTGSISSPGWRDIVRGIMVVLIFTPWYAGDSPEFYAPAFVVLMMDVLLEGTKSGLKGGIVLLAAAFLMLLVLTLRQWRRGRRPSV